MEVESGKPGVCMQGCRGTCSGACLNRHKAWVFDLLFPRLPSTHECVHDPGRLQPHLGARGTRKGI